MHFGAQRLPVEEQIMGLVMAERPLGPRSIQRIRWDSLPPMNDTAASAPSSKVTSARVMSA